MQKNLEVSDISRTFMVLIRTEVLQHHLLLTKNRTTMDSRTFELFSSINCDELESEDWGLFKAAGMSKDYFGWETKENVRLDGDYLYVYGGDGIVLTDKDDDPIVPDITLHSADDDDECTIQIYKV